MPRRVVRLPQVDPAFDLVSYGRRGGGAPAALSPGQVAQVARTVGCVPEVMVKVSGGARDVGGALAHLKYIDRHGKLAVETDEGPQLQGKGVEQQLIDDWELQTSPGAHRPAPPAGQVDTRSKIAHNIVLSMPAGTPPDAVLEAARRFARENFALQYRYAMVLHTDQAHPHVHLMVKAHHEFEAGKRLVIRKATLRQWREQFAACMREQGVAANATPRQLRGRTEVPLKDPIYRRLLAMRLPNPHQAIMSRSAVRRGPVGSHFMRRKVSGLVRQLSNGNFSQPEGQGSLEATRAEVQADWARTAAALRAQGHSELAAQVDQFVGSMPPPRTDQQRVAEQLRAQAVREKVLKTPSRSR